MRTYQIPRDGTVYVYQAAFLCEACGERTRAALDAEGKRPEKLDSDLFCSMDYPAGPYQAEVTETCDSMDRCLNLRNDAP